MLDLAWSEIALIAVVALVVIGPKDLPEAVRGAARALQGLRRKIGEFQSQADELVREAKLDEVRNQIHEVRSAVSEFRNFDLRGEVERNVDPDGSLRRGFSDPLGGGADTVGGTAWSAPAEPAPPAVTDDATRPAFIPPNATPPASSSAPPLNQA